MHRRRSNRQFFHLHRLAQEVVSSRANRLDGILFFALPGNDDDLSRVIDGKYVG